MTDLGELETFSDKDIDKIDRKLVEHYYKPLPNHYMNYIINGEIFYDQDLPDNIKIAFKIFFIGPINHYNKQLINLKLRKLGLKKFFKITGFIKCDSSKIMKKLDIVFSLTKSFEGFGLSIAEALLAKKPVIATKVGGVTEFLNNNNSKLIEPNNKKAIKSSIIDFYNNKKQG